MSSQYTNGAAVPIHYIPTSGPTPGGSIADDPPPYSECVSYPPTISNCQKTNAPLPPNPPEEYPGKQIGTYVHDAIPSAPLFDANPILPSYSNSYNPTITPNFVDLSSSNDSTQTNVPVYIHRTKVLTPQTNPRRAGSKRNSIKMCVSGAFGIAVFFIIVSVIILRPHIRKQPTANTKVINRLDDVSIEFEESYGKEMSQILNNNNDGFEQTNIREDEYNEFLKTNKDRDQNNEFHRNWLLGDNDYMKEILNEFRRKINIPTLPTNITFSEMYDETMNRFLKTDPTLERLRRSTKSIPTRSDDNP